MKLFRSKTVHYHRATSFKKMAFSFILSMLFIMLAMAILYLSTAKQQINSLSDSLLLRSYEQYDRQLSTLFSQIETSFLTLGNGFTSMEEDLQLYDGTPKSIADALESARQTLRNNFQITFQNTSISYSICFFPNESFGLSDELVRLSNPYNFTGSTWLYNDADVKDTVWYQNACASPNTLQWYIPEDHPDLIYIASSLSFSMATSTKLQKVNLGVLLLVIPSSSFQRELKIPESQELMLLNKDGMVLYSSCDMTDELLSITSAFCDGTYSDGLIHLTIDNTNCNVCSRQMNWGLRLVFLESGSQYNSLLVQFYRLFIGSFLLCLLTGTLLMLYFSRRFSIPLEFLAQGMESSLLHHISLPASRPSIEVQTIYNSYNKMVDRILNLMEKNKAVSRQKELLELSTL